MIRPSPKLAYFPSSRRVTRVLYISYDGLTDPLGQSQILPYLIGLTKYDHSFHILSFEKKEALGKNKEGIKKQINHLNITWHALSYHKWPPIISTLYDLLVMHKQAKRLVRQHGIQLIHCRSYLTGLVGLTIKRRFGIKFLFDIRGFWANERVDGGIWNLTNPAYWLIYRYFKKKETEMMSEADHIISLTHAGKEEIVSGRLFEYPCAPIAESKITVIPCAVDLELFDPTKISELQKNDLRQALGVRAGEKLLCYLGSIGTWYLLDEMLQFYKNWKAQHPEFRFLFVTPDQPKTIVKAAAKYGVNESDLIITSTSRELVPLHLSIPDIGIFFIRPSYSKKASFATKMGEMLAMRLPMITNKGVGDGDYLFEKYGGGTLVEINKLHNIKWPLPSGKMATFFSLENGVNAYLQVYRKLYG